MKRKVFFHHIPKTAGTSLRKAFAEIYGERQVSPKVSLRVSEALESYDSSAVVCGHLQVGPGDRLPADYYSLTVLRDPFDRFLSEFYFTKYDFHTHTPATRLFRDLSLDEFLASPAAREAYLWNGQTNVLYMYSFDGSAIPGPEERLAAAKRALDAFDLVVTQDEIEDALPIMALELGWPTVPNLSRENVTTRRTGVDALTAAQREDLSRLNALDIELFDHARRLFKTKRRSILSLAALSEPKGRARAEEPLIASAAADASAVVAPTEFGDRAVEITSVTIQSLSGDPSHTYTGELIRLRIEFASHIREEDLTVGFSIHDRAKRVVFGSNTNLLGMRIRVAPDEIGATEFEWRNDLGGGRYDVAVSLHPGESHLKRAFHLKDSAAHFEVVGNLGEHFDGIVKLYPRVTVTRNGQHVQAIALGDVVMLGRSNRPLHDFSALLTGSGPPSALAPGAQFVLFVDVLNTGTETWPSHGDKPVRLGYHWLKEDFAWIVYDGIRSPLRADCRPGEIARVPVTVRAPDYEGRCLLVVTPIQEQVAWFENLQPEARVVFPTTIQRNAAED